MFEIHHYVTATGVDLFARWLEELADRQARARVKTRIDRVSLGNFGDVEQNAKTYFQDYKRRTEKNSSRQACHMSRG